MCCTGQHVCCVVQHVCCDGQHVCCAVQHVCCAGQCVCVLHWTAYVLRCAICVLCWAVCVLRCAHVCCTTRCVVYRPKPHVTTCLCKCYCGARCAVKVNDWFSSTRYQLQAISSFIMYTHEYSTLRMSSPTKVGRKLFVFK